MLNLFQHLFIKRFRNKFGMTLYWITSPFHCLGLFGISQKRGFAPSYGLTPYQKFALRSKKCCEIIKQIETSNRFFVLFGRNKRHRSNLNQKAWFLIINFHLSLRSCLCSLCSRWQKWRHIEDLAEISIFIYEQIIQKNKNHLEENEEKDGISPLYWYS